MSPGPRLDLHVHSDRSPDGRSSVDELVAAAVERGLSGIALTDHNTVAGHARLAEVARIRPELLLLPGVEVSTADGHLLVYGTVEAPPPRRPWTETFAWVRDRGGVAVPAHPFRFFHGAGAARTGVAPVPAIETVNGHNGRTANTRARRLAESRSLGGTGGSDAHAAREVGVAWTVFPVGVGTPEALLEALARGATTADGLAAGGFARARASLRSFGLRFRRGLRPI